MTKRFSALFSQGILVALSGCGQAADDFELDPMVGSVEQAFGEASCSTATPDQTLRNSTPGTTVVGVTPTTYSNPKCYKAFIFDLGMLPSNGFPQPVLSPYDIFVSWTDPWPRTRAQCATTLGIHVYTPTFSWGPITADSVWENGACKLGRIGLSSAENPRGSSLPRVGVLQVNNQVTSLGIPYLGNEQVRLSVTARTAANYTQSVKVAYTVNPASSPPPPCPDC